MALNETNQGGGPGGAEREPGLDRLYHAAGREEPPAHLDAAILAAARREVGARPRPLSSTLHRWRVPVSIAAVVVLSVSLVTLVREEGGEQLMQAPPLAPAQPPDARTAPAAPVASEMTQPRPAATAPAPTRRAPREEARTDEAPADLGKMAGGLTDGAAGPMASQGAGAVSAPDAAERSRPQAFRDVPSPAERRANMPQASPPADDSAPRAPGLAERRGAPLASAPAGVAVGARSTVQARKEAASANVQLPVWHGYEKEPPQKWLERIAELKRERRIAEAEAMLAEFKRRFPGHPLPTERQ
jgi:hypothetical protein